MPKNDKLVILNRLKELAGKKATDEGRKITQHIIAKEAGISVPTVRNYINNTNVLDDKRVIAKLLVWLNIGIEEFYYTKDSDSSESEDQSSKHLNAPLLATA